LRLICREFGNRVWIDIDHHLTGTVSVDDAPNRLSENKGVRTRLLTFWDSFGIFHGSWDDQRERQMVAHLSRAQSS